MTGCSIGFGRRLAQAAARRGDRTIAIARTVVPIDEMAAPFASRTDSDRS